MKMDVSEEDKKNTRQSRLCLERTAKRYRCADTPGNCEPEDADDALQPRSFKMAKIEVNHASQPANTKVNPEKQQTQATKPANDTATELNAQYFTIHAWLLTPCFTDSTLTSPCS